MKRQPLRVVFCWWFWCLVLDVRHQSHEASALDSTSKVALPFGSHASAATVEHTGVWVDTAFKASDVFVVNVMLWDVDGVFSFCGHVLEIIDKS